MRPNWFIGLPVPAADWILELLEGGPEGVRFFHPDDLHITLAFLGAVDPEQARSAWIATESRSLHSLSIVPGKVRPFGSKGKPSALSFVLERGHDEIAGYMDRNRTAILRCAGAPPDERQPLPHVTIARIPRRADAALRSAALDWADTIQAAKRDLFLDRIALYTWAEDRSLRKFDIVEQRALLA